MNHQHKNTTINHQQSNEIALRRGIKNGWDAAWHMAMRIDSIHELRLEMARAAIAAHDAYYDLLPNVRDVSTTTNNNE